MRGVRGMGPTYFMRAVFPCLTTLPGPVFVLLNVATCSFLLLERGRSCRDKEFPRGCPYCVELIADWAPLDICQLWYLQVQIEIPLLRWRLSSSSLRTFAFKTNNDIDIDIDFTCPTRHTAVDDLLTLHVSAPRPVLRIVVDVGLADAGRMPINEAERKNRQQSHQVHRTAALQRLQERSQVK